MRAGRHLHAATAVLLGSSTLLLVVVTGTPRSVDAEDVPPDIVVVLTDDQRWDTLWAMPNVQGLLAAKGVTFTEAFTVNPLCCPSRASILTGAYSHTTQVYTNEPPFGGFSVFDDLSTVATWLYDAGYRTGLSGKYLNGYGPLQSMYIPPGWERWVAFVSGKGSGGYFEYKVSVDGVRVAYGRDPDDYSTDVLASEADSFIRSTPVDQPLFLYFAPKAPHYPSTPAPRHVDVFADLPPARPPSYNEADVSDKPRYVQSIDPWDELKMEAVDQRRRHEYETLLAVDDAVGVLVTALEETGRLGRTMIVFTSDNGLLHGEHRLTGKQHAYDESIRVPLVIRYDPSGTEARTEARIALNIDLAPTFADVASLDAPGVEGRSLVPLLFDTGTRWRRDTLVENVGLPGEPPTYCADRTERFLYAKYATGEEELYDMWADPFQLDNRASDPTFASELAALRGRLTFLCDPPPPEVESQPV